MSELFIKLYLDEDVDVLIADLLRGRGFDVSTTLEDSQLGSSDEAQLAHATKNRMTLLTHNRSDFEALALENFYKGETHYGIIVAVRRTPYAIVSRLLRILNNVTADEMENQIRYI